MGLNYVDISVAPPIFTETTIIPGKQGIQGIQGISGVYVGENAPTEADGEYNVWIKTNGEEMDFTGNGIKNFQYSYSVSNDEQIPDTWQATPPSANDSVYAWTKIDVKMTNNEVENKTFYVVAKQGTPAGFDDSKCTATIPENDTWAENPTVTVDPVGGNTDKGFQFAFKHLRGKGIKSVRALYAVHTSPTQAPDNFSTSLPEVVGQDKYLWTKVEVEVDDGTVYAFPFVSKTGDKGEKGDTGAPAGFGTVTAEVGSNVGSNDNGSKPRVEVTADGDNTAKKLHFNFDYLRGATFTPRIEGGVLKWNCDNTALAKPADFDVVGGVQAAMGGYTIRKSSTAPAAGTSDNIITLVTEG